MLQDFDLFYKDFISNFDLNFDLGSIYESLKQIQVSNQVNLISQLENGCLFKISFWFLYVLSSFSLNLDIKNYETLKENIIEHQRWSKEVERLIEVETGKYSSKLEYI